MQPPALRQRTLENSGLRLCVPWQDFICDHYGEDSSAYDQELRELMELRQVPDGVGRRPRKLRLS